MSIFSPRKKPLTENQVLKKLDIPDFRHITKDKVMHFASMTGQMDPEVAKAAITQFPEFSSLVVSGMADYKEIMLETLAIDSEESKICLAFYNRVMTALENELNAGDSDAEVRRWCIDQMRDVSDKVAEYIKGNRDHRFKKVATFGGVVALAVGFCITALGGNFDIDWPFGGKDK